MSSTTRRRARHSDEEASREAISREHGRLREVRVRPSGRVSELLMAAAEPGLRIGRIQTERPLKIGHRVVVTRQRSVGRATPRVERRLLRLVSDQVVEVPDDVGPLTSARQVDRLLPVGRLADDLVAHRNQDLAQDHERQPVVVGNQHP